VRSVRRSGRTRALSGTFGSRSWKSVGRDGRTRDHDAALCFRLWESAGRSGPTRNPNTTFSLLRWLRFLRPLCRDWRTRCWREHFRWSYCWPFHWLGPRCRWLCRTYDWHWRRCGRYGRRLCRLLWCSALKSRGRSSAACLCSRIPRKIHSYCWVQCQVHSYSAIRCQIHSGREIRCLIYVSFTRNMYTRLKFLRA
jgi:hypothetical protein